MHPTLRIENLGRLPFPFQRFADAACTPARIIEDIMCTQYALTLIKPAERVGLLPVFYLNLDPGRMPSADQIDRFTPTTRTDITSAAFSLVTILQIDAPRAVALEMWPRIWSWFNFIDTYRDYFPDTELPSQKNLFTYFLVFTRHLYEDRSAYSGLLSTAGFARTIVKAWTFLSTLEETNLVARVLGDLSLFMLDTTEGLTPENLDEVLEGAGGSFDDLARLMLTFLRLIVPPPPAVMTEHQVSKFRSLLFFLSAVDFDPNAETEHTVTLGDLFKQPTLQR
ncbi:hypothetical protein DFH06DRAFT_1317276 [Mycena polygramma]|nr:hypothetical protein DFH06DRAFT_1317276 [Mycena polygramma]